MATFGPWEDHLRKHYRDPERTIVFEVMAALSEDVRGRDLDALLASVRRPDLARNTLRELLVRLDTEGFIAVDSWEHESPTVGFLNPLLRRWWQRYPPSATG